MNIQMRKQRYRRLMGQWWSLISLRAVMQTKGAKKAPGVDLLDRKIASVNAQMRLNDILIKRETNEHRKQYV